MYLKVNDGKCEMIALAVKVWLHCTVATTFLENWYETRSVRISQFL